MAENETQEELGVRLANEVIDELIQEELAEALTALNELPSLWQAIGTTAAHLRRCKHGTPGFKKWDTALTKFQNDAHEKTSLVRCALRAAKNAGKRNK